MKPTDKTTSEFCLNPSLSVRLHVSWNGRDAGPRSLDLTSTSDPALFQFVCRLLARDEDVVVPEDELQRLRDLDLVIPTDRIQRIDVPLPATMPPLMPRYVDDVPLELGHLRLSSECHLQRAADLPDTICDLERAEGAVSSRRPILWVQDPGTRVFGAYHVEGTVGEVVLALFEGRASVANIPGEVRDLLVRAGVLTSDELRNQRMSAWSVKCAYARKELNERGFAVLRQVLNPIQLACYRVYLRALEREGWLEPDPQVPAQRRHSLYREPLCEFLHAQSQFLIDRIVPGARPSYSFLGVYQPGAILEKHTDRPQCQWNVSLVLDAEPEPEESASWPLYIEGQRGPEPVRLNVGDAVLYSGCDTPHWRDAQPSGHKTTAVFFHYVSAEYTGSLD